MPLAPRSACTSAGCTRTANERGKCAEHFISLHREIERDRGSAHSRGYNRKWSFESKAFRFNNPECADPYQHHGQMKAPATLVDHKIPHRGSYALFWDHSNWQSLCASCHGEKTAREDGRWGRSERKAKMGNV